MKFISLRLKNFKPYYASGEPQEIVLYDDNNKNRNITLNMGQTGYGKTSISEAILWCLFGEMKYPNWEVFVNTLSIEVAEELKAAEAVMCVELLVDKDGEKYRIIRNGVYDVTNQNKLKDSELCIIQNGEPIDRPEEFIINNFPKKSLMEYFIFDADDISKKFEENQERTIGDHINKLIGLEKLDSIIESLESVMKIYENEINSIEEQIQDDLTERKREIWEDMKRKEEAIKTIDNEIAQFGKKKKKLFEKLPTSEEKMLYELISNRDELKDKIIELNQKFVDKKITPDLDLLILEPVISSLEDKATKEKTSKEEFDASSKIIKDSLGKDYVGVFFDKKDSMKIIKKNAIINQQDLGDVNELALKVGGGIKSDIVKVLYKYKEDIKNQKIEFKEIHDDYKILRDKLYKVQNKIDQVGETAGTKQAKEKYERFKKIEKDMEGRKSTKKEIQEMIKVRKKEIKDLQEKITLDETQKKEIKFVEEKKKFAEVLMIISKKAREQFLSTLINFVNKKASEFMRNTVKDINRFFSIEIDTNYKFCVKQKNGVPLKQDQINKGTLTISMLSFFFGLSHYLEKEIPYIIDNPMIRLDPGHDKRLIEQLVEKSDQVVLHLIPGKEYTTDSFNWLKPNINIQNWIYRNEYMQRDDLISTTERKDENCIVEFDIDKF